KAHHHEERSADYAAANFPRLAEANQGETDGGEVAEGIEVFDAGPEVLNLRHGPCDVLVSDARRALADIDQPVFIAVDQWFQEHSAHEGEHRSVSADAEGERHDHGEGQPLGAPERVGGHSQITKK